MTDYCDSKGLNFIEQLNMCCPSGEYTQDQCIPLETQPMVDTQQLIEPLQTFEPSVEPFQPFQKSPKSTGQIILLVVLFGIIFFAIYSIINMYFDEMTSKVLVIVTFVILVYIFYTMFK